MKIQLPATVNAVVITNDERIALNNIKAANKEAADWTVVAWHGESPVYAWEIGG